MERPLGLRLQAARRLVRLLEVRLPAVRLLAVRQLVRLSVRLQAL